MHCSTPLTTALFLFITAAYSTPNTNPTPRTGLLKRDTQLSCPSGGVLFSGFDALCVADSGTSICGNRLSTCCQLPDGETPYLCPGLDYPHCCGTGKPECGADPSCKDMKGDRDVEDAETAVTPSQVEITATPTGTATRGAGQAALVTMAAEENPNESEDNEGTGTMGASISKGGFMMVMVAAAAVALF